MTIKTKKTVYEEPAASDGKRVLVMRTWPRGISKSKVDVWLKELGTEKELIRRWKAGEVGWPEYSRAYRASLAGKVGLLERLAADSREGTITLLCACKDEAHCHRTLLRHAIEGVM